MVDAECHDPDKHLPVGGDRVGNLPDLEDLGSAGLGDNDRAHVGSPSAWNLTVNMTLDS